MEDDKKLGINSTPLWWGSKTLLIIAILQFAVISFLLIVGLKAELSSAWYIGIILLSGFYFYQHQLASQKNFLLAFKNNHWASLYLLTPLSILFSDNLISCHLKSKKLIYKKSFIQ